MSQLEANDAYVIHADPNHRIQALRHMPGQL